MFGFRSDGKKVKNVSLLFRIIPHIMKTRNDSQVYFRQDVPIKFMDAYINKKAQEGVKISYMHIIYAAIIRTIYERPWLNRFVMDGRTYDRNDIFVSLFTLKNKSNAINLAGSWSSSPLVVLLSSSVVLVDVSI